MDCALRLGIDAFPAPLVAVKCPDCHKAISDLTAHELSCPSKVAQGQRTRLHTAMDIAVRLLFRELDSELTATGTQDAYPANKRFAVSNQCPEALNHHADIYVYDMGTVAGHLIDFTFTNSARSTGKNGAAPGGHADEAEDAKYAQYAKEFPGISAESSPALRILTTERHGTPSKGTRTYWKELVAAASERQKANTEFPVHISVLTRCVRQTLAIALFFLAR